jgi:hypothetical protein
MLSPMEHSQSRTQFLFGFQSHPTTVPIRSRNLATATHRLMARPLAFVRVCLYL